MQGAKYVFHTACVRLQPGTAARVQQVCPLLTYLRLPCRSPFIIKVEDTQRDLIDPAVKGTRNVLAAAAKAKASVQRVVLTSSVAGLLSPWLHGQLGCLHGTASKGVCSLACFLSRWVLPRRGIQLKHTVIRVSDVGLHMCNLSTPSTKADMQDGTRSCLYPDMTLP